MKEKLKKYSPLGLLALVIVAGVVGIVAKSVSDDAKDAGFDVIGYFYCEPGKRSDQNFVLIAEEDTFQVLRYDSSNDEVVARGKPTDLRYFTRHTISNFEASYSSFEWKEDNDAYKLYRSNGRLVRTTPGLDLSEFPDYFSRGGYKAIGIDTPTSWRHDCKFGDEGKKLIWKLAIEEYEYVKPKF